MIEGQQENERKMMVYDMGRERFRLGRILATPAALSAMDIATEALGDLLRRHQRGDWGATCAEDTQSNEDALRTGGRIFSVYILSNGIKLWIITEADRAATTALLPEEY